MLGTGTSNNTDIISIRYLLCFPIPIMGMMFLFHCFLPISADTEQPHIRVFFYYFVVVDLVFGHNIVFHNESRRYLSCTFQKIKK